MPDTCGIVTSGPACSKQSHTHIACSLDIDLTDVETHPHRRTHVPKLGAQVQRFNWRRAAEFRAVKDRPIAATSRHPNLVGVCTLAPRLVSCLLLSRFSSAIDSARTHTHTLYTSLPGGQHEDDNHSGCSLSPHRLAQALAALCAHSRQPVRPRINSRVL